MTGNGRSTFFASAQERLSQCLDVRGIIVDVDRDTDGAPSKRYIHLMLLQSGLQSRQVHVRWKSHSEQVAAAPPVFGHEEATISEVLMNMGIKMKLLDSPTS
jgi:hypothetical protein